MSSDQERERLRRLQEKQLRDRDPGPRVKVEWKTEPRKQDPILKELWQTLPKGFKGAILGGVFGVVTSIAMSFVLPEPWGTACGMIFFLVAIGVGFAIGRSTDHGGYMD